MGEAEDVREGILRVDGVGDEDVRRWKNGGGGGIEISGDTCVASVDATVWMVPGEGGKTELVAERGIDRVLSPCRPVPAVARLSCGLGGWSFKLGGRPRWEEREGCPEFLRSLAVIGLGER